MEFKALCISSDEDRATSWEIYRCKIVCNNWGCNTLYFGDDKRWHLFDDDILERI